MQQEERVRNGYVGASLKRKEDPRLLAGEGCYVGDIRLPNMAYAAVVRSTHAHARLRGCDVQAAAAVPGVLRIFTAADFGSPPQLSPELVPHPELRACPPPVIASDRVRYVGEPVALVVAEDAYAALDGKELVQVAYEPLPVIVDSRSAIEPSSPCLHDGLGDNVAARVSRRCAEPERAFDDADLVVAEQFSLSRGTAQSMETRGILAYYDEVTGMLRVWNSTQTPHQIRWVLATLFDLPEHRVHVSAPDVGGGFGPKGNFYPEEYLIPFAAMQLGRPVRWLEDRLEHSMCTYSEHTQLHDAALALRRDGSILALRDSFLAETGAYVAYGMVVSLVTLSALLGCYRIPNFDIGYSLVYTNKVPSVPVRGAGQPQANFVIERLLDRAAGELGMAPEELRFKNLVQADEMPYKTGIVHNGVASSYDSGDFSCCLRGVMEKIDFPAARREQGRQREAGRHLGIGLACYVETTGLGPYEGATVSIDAAGKIVVISGASSQGQGHATTLAQVCADELGVEPHEIEVVGGDSASIPHGVGTFASRTAVVAANATAQAARAVREKVLTLAAVSLEANPEDLEIGGGKVAVRGSAERAITLGALARLAKGGHGYSASASSPGLRSTEYFYPTAATYSSGAHAAVVEVDVESGSVRLLRFAVVEDCGRMINPLIVDGQVIGGIAHGIASTLFEDVQYDDTGQPLACSLMDYLLPVATDLPSIEISHVENLSTRNPQGIKGVGESGVIAVPAVIVSAVEDALRPYGVKITSFPLSPERLFQLIQNSR